MSETSLGPTRRQWALSFLPGERAARAWWWWWWPLIPSSVAVTNEWSCISTPPICVRGFWTGTLCVHLHLVKYIPNKRLKLCGFFYPWGPSFEPHPRQCIDQKFSWLPSATPDKHRVSFPDFKLSPCFDCCIISFGQFPGVWILNVDVSEHCLFTSSDAWELPKRNNTTGLVPYNK
jgi:hypothetical protein